VLYTNRHTDSKASFYFLKTKNTLKMLTYEGTIYVNTEIHDCDISLGDTDSCLGKREMNQLSD
jgi:hypothetical protein